MPLLTTAEPQEQRPLSLFSAAALALGAAVSFARLRFALPLAAYDDDAFYYFQIARNIATGHGSSFDGIHHTNGYHPLWMLVCVVLSWLATGRAFFVLLQCVSFASFVVCFFAARKLFRQACRQNVLAEIAAVAVALQCLILTHGGMEITLTLPLALLLCVYRLRTGFTWSSRSAAIYGSLAALVVLSRLDSLLWIMLLLCGEFVLASRDSTKPYAKLILAAFIGALPLALYALSNHHWFHVWMPVSGMSKELRLHHGFTLAGLRSSLYLLDQVYGPLVVYPALVVMLCAIARVLWPRQAPQRIEVRAVAVSLMLFPVVQLLALGFTSDWAIWSWYLYPFVLAMLGALLLLLGDSPAKHEKARPGFYLPALLTCSLMLPMGVLYLATAIVGTEQPRWAAFALDLQGFARSHPGIYAMGDCAGASGYVVPQPIVQTEGLVMDAAFLNNIRKQRDLRDVLQSYNVSYYVTLRATQVNGCFHVEEPAQGGPDSPRMRTTLCQSPVASFHEGPVELRVFEIPPTPAK